MKSIANLIRVCECKYVFGYVIREILKGLTMNVRYNMTVRLFTQEFSLVDEVQI